MEGKRFSLILGIKRWIRSWTLERRTLDYFGRKYLPGERLLTKLMKRANVVNIFTQLFEQKQ